MTYCLWGVFLAMAVVVIHADHDTLVLYTRTEDGVSSFASSDFAFDGSHSPGATYITRADMYLDETRTGDPVAFQSAACFQLLGFWEVQCMGSVTFNDGSGSITLQGHYLETETPGTPSINTLAITGGSGDFQGISGQITLTHHGVDPDPTTGIHHIHDSVWSFVATQNMFKE